MGLLISKEDAQKIIDKLTDLENFAYNLTGPDTQGDFTELQNALADEGIAMPFLQGGIVQDLITKHEGNFMKVAEALKRIIARINNLPLPPAFVPVAPSPAAPAA